LKNADLGGEKFSRKKTRPVKSKPTAATAATGTPKPSFWSKFGLGGKKTKVALQPATPVVPTQSTKPLSAWTAPKAMSNMERFVSGVLNGPQLKLPSEAPNLKRTGSGSSIYSSLSEVSRDSGYSDKSVKSVESVYNKLGPKNLTPFSKTSAYTEGYGPLFNSPKSLLPPVPPKLKPTLYADPNAVRAERAAQSLQILRQSKPGQVGGPNLPPKVPSRELKPGDVDL
jgi:hypothetical protein